VCIERAEQWQVVLEDREAVIAALERAECDGILPAAHGFFDRFADFCAEIALLELLNLLPDPRARASIPHAFFGNVLMHKQLLRIPSFAQMGRVLFTSPAVLRRLGFNWRQAQEGFYASEGRKPFNEEALADFFARIDRDALWNFQLRMLPQLMDRCPELFGDGTLMMDCIDITVPAGHYDREGGKYKACVLASYRDGCIYPLLCLFGDEHARGPDPGQAGHGGDAGVCIRPSVDAAFGSGALSTVRGSANSSARALMWLSASRATCTCTRMRWGWRVWRDTQWKAGGAAEV
jgi:hypothetical protein